jgi:hypothetical protein
VREDPKRKGLLYLGTERGLRFSRDGGATWEEWKLNLPTVAVTDLVVKDDDLVLSTNGRSLWVFDDLTPIREWAPAAAAAGGDEQEVRLLPARPAYRWRYRASLGDEGPRAGAQENPPEGAFLHYALTKEAKEVVLEILDGKGALVRKLTSKEEEKEDKDELEGEYEGEKEKKEPLPKQPGLHRVVWDLRYQGAEVIKKAKFDGGNPKEGPLVLPGEYTVKLLVDGKTAETKVRVLADPRIAPSDAEAIKRLDEIRRGTDGPPPPDAAKPKPHSIEPKELEEQLKFALQIRDDITRLTRTVEQLRAVKKQLADRNELLKDDEKAEPLVKASKEFIVKLDALEEKLHNPKAKVSYDILAQKGGAKLYSQLAWLLEVLKESDGAPTQGVREVYAEQAKLLEQYEKEWNDLTAGDMAKLNEQAKKLDIPGVFVPPVDKEKDKDGKPEN